MRKTDKTVNGRRYILETYESFDEITRTCEQREVKGNVREPARKEQNARFMGAKSYDEAVQMLKYGYEKDIDRINKAVKDLQKTGTAMRTSFRNDIVGFAPVVPNAIIGVPQSMINSVRTPKKAKVITLVVDMSVNGSVSREDVFSYGVKVVQKVIQLEQSGFRVRLEYMKCVNDDYRQHLAVSTVIKNENQPLDIKRIMFPLTNVAMQRYISWDWYDRLPDVKWDGGRGRALSDLNRENRQKVIDQFVKDQDNKYIVVYGDDLDRVFANVA